MTLSKSVLGALMKTKIMAIPGANITSETELQSFCDAMADAVVTHIVSAAVVIATASNVSSGAGTAPVSGGIS